MVSRFVFAPNWENGITPSLPRSLEGMRSLELLALTKQVILYRDKTHPAAIEQGKTGQRIHSRLEPLNWGSYTERSMVSGSIHIDETTGHS
ncbi:hypothetical protein M404DRAFT_1003060 [Pisolithus tinctorius Marx 270]|uniref:Uncharacterized protein n=1 Tax=Pisolithus tinctorius Marx 270 TaxID=870435 RepID=A0A0C3JVA7_PISTI|nr:hypothetical protein M404DRAFT_1003060 [Pisolithus tinctorius Marx 270]